MALNAEITSFVAECEDRCREIFDNYQRIEEFNTGKVLRTFIEHRISARHFTPTTGYGYDDIGRDTLDRVFARILGTESALVRPQIVSGTHALALCLYGILRPGDTLLSAAGKPYDTLEQVIGINGTAGGQGSLSEFGIRYRQADLRDGKVDLDAVLAALDKSTRMVLIQRSRGYDWRPSLSVSDIGTIAKAVHAAKPDTIVMVDNCYGEFTDTTEPGHVGADLMAGSLIKNPGGGIAPTGGYIAGRQDLIDLAAARLTTPGIGSEVGSYAAGYQPFYQGLFLAPHVVMQALRVATLCASVMERLGFAVHPRFDEPRNDIIEAIRFENPDLLIRFIQEIQCFSPVDSEAVPEPWDMPGYQDPVIMAAGTFVAGASIELSADAPIRPPYICYLQGGLTYAHGKLALIHALSVLHEEGRLQKL